MGRPGVTSSSCRLAIWWLPQDLAAPAIWRLPRLLGFCAGYASHYEGCAPRTGACLLVCGPPSSLLASSELGRLVARLARGCLWFCGGFRRRLARGRGGAPQPVVAELVGAFLARCHALKQRGVKKHVQTDMFSSMILASLWSRVSLEPQEPSPTVLITGGLAEFVA